MKKIMRVMILVIALLICLCGCGGTNLARENASEYYYITAEVDEDSLEGNFPVQGEIKVTCTPRSSFGIENVQLELEVYNDIGFYVGEYSDFYAGDQEKIDSGIIDHVTIYIPGNGQPGVETIEFLAPYRILEYDSWPHSVSVRVLSASGKIKE